MVVTKMDTGSLKEPLSANQVVSAMPGLAASQSLSVVTNVADTHTVSADEHRLTDDSFNNGGTLERNGVVVVGMGGGGGGLCPKAVLVCRPNSHPFQDRTLMLDQAVKVGRSVARARPSPTNAIFDCKVLSRNHALLWYEQGKFYLQDTKSSNGTFVNNQRLSKGSEESLPREVCSGDILQFGVDVMENSRKVTHGCIIATLKLYLPDGKEAKASPTIMSSLAGGGVGNGFACNGNLQTQDLYQLNQYIQEALAREQLLETKLAVLQRLVGQTEVASSDAWKSLIDEDRLLTRVEILESQLSAYSKCMTEDKLRDEAQRLMEEKEEYQEVAKDTLKKLVDEKLEAVKKMQDLEKQLSTTEDEFAVLKELYERNAEENKDLATEVSKMREELEVVRQKIPPEPVPEVESKRDEETEKAESAIETTEATSQENQSEGRQTEDTEDDAFKASGVSELTSESCNITVAEPNSDSADVPREVLGKQETIVAAVEQDEEGPNDVVSALRAQVSELTENERGLRAELEKCKSQWESEKRDILAEKGEQGEKVEDDEVRSLKEQLEEERELRRRSQVSEVAKAAVSADEELNGSILDVSLNDSLAEAEEKIAQLLKVKERYAVEREANSRLETSVVELEKEVSRLGSYSQTATAVAAVPIAILFLYFLSYFMSIFGGSSDKV